MVAIPRGKTVLVTGGQGQLARDLVRRFTACDWNVHAPSRAELDVSDRTAVLERVSGLRPDVVVNAAAWTDPQGCEADPARAWATHAMAVRYLAEAVRATGAHLCQISTDYVFDGTPGGTHTEWDAPAATSVYGRSKLGGEHEVPDGATVVRTSRLLSRHGNNVARNVLRLAAANPDQQFRFDDNHRGCVTFTADLAVAIEALASARMPGMYHVTNQGVTTWYGFVRALLQEAGHDPGRVAPFAGDVGNGALARPESSVLDNVALPAAGFALLPAWRSSLPGFIDAFHARAR
jgi:dTDP-4-dehydrorhamnose reductase